MSEAKHTPGPWEISKRFNREFFASGAEQGMCSVRSDDWFIATIENAEEWEANALLIATAPDLLATVKAARELLSSCARDTAGTPSEDEFRSMVLTCDLAIAKAEGRQ